MKAIDYTNIKYGRNSLSIAQAGFKKKWNTKNNILLKLIQLVLIFYLDHQNCLKYQYYLIFSKELFNSSIFSREEILKLMNKNNKINNSTGNKVIIEIFLNIKNK